MDAAAVSYPGFEVDLAALLGSRAPERPRTLPAAGTARLYAARRWLSRSTARRRRKSSVARAVAEELGFTYLDSGAMYRCVALAALEARRRPRRRRGPREVAQSWRSASTAAGLSAGATSAPRSANPESPPPPPGSRSIPQVRKAMVARQRQLIAAGKYVAEGRDIGTVVSPDSPLKVFLTASHEERARRRAARPGKTPSRS